jgi:hypothetical protein
VVVAVGGSKVEVKGQYFFFNFFSSILTFFHFFSQNLASAQSCVVDV